MPRDFADLVTKLAPRLGSIMPSYFDFFFDQELLLELKSVVHHQHLMCVAFLNVYLSRLEHPMQFNELIVHVVHMVVQNEQTISDMKRF
jgi:hypothetical protein